MGSITKRLGDTFTTGAPIIGLASFNGYWNRGFLGDDGFRHGSLDGWIWELSFYLTPLNFYRFAR
jgi:hypothetical protein